MRTPVATFFVWAAWTCLAGGCGKNDSGGAGSSDGFIQEICAEYTDCCRAAGRPADGKQCRAFYGAFAPSTGYDPVAGQACLDEVRALSDKCDSAGSNTPSCDKVFSGAAGTAKPGEACEDNRDCAPSDAGEVECVSHFSDGAETSLCQERLHGVEGSSPCIGTVEGNSTSFFGSGGDAPSGYLCHVSENLACDTETGACQKLPAVGEACGGGFYDCAPNAYCSFSDDQCLARHELGEACTQSDECQDGAYCPSGGGTCTAQSAVGAACVTGSECASGTCSNGKCGASNDLALAFLCGSN